MKFTQKLILFIAATVLLALPCEVNAKKVTKKVAKVDIYELTLDENVESPMPELELVAKNVVAFQYDVAVMLKQQKLDVELMRDNQVIVVTVPASRLFEPNDTVLTQLGKTSLKPMLPFLKSAGLYKMLLVMHSDNTGSDAYNMNLTLKRVNSVFDWVELNASTDYVVPYALGATDPAVDNNSLENRKRNRRLEIYLVPEEGMLELAKKGKISTNIIKK